MQFTAMLRYDPSDPFTLKLGRLMSSVGIHIDGIPTVIQGGEMLTCGCTLDPPAASVRRYHESVLQYQLGEIEKIAKKYGLTTAEIVDYLTREQEKA